MCVYECTCVSDVYPCTVKPLNKGHVGDNINSHALSLVERLSSSQRFKLYNTIEKCIFWGVP